MTLVLACLTKDVVYQVSDRRFTYLGDPDREPDDEENKAVVVNGRVTFAYSGLAWIGKERSDDWLARVIADGPTDDMAQVARRIKDRATLDFNRLKLPAKDKRKRHAFQGVGWFRLTGEDWNSPGIVTIDNALDHRTGSWLSEPLPEFQVTTQFPSKLPGDCILNSVGVTPSPDEKDAVLRLVRKCVKHRRATPRAVVHSLIIALRWLRLRHPPIGPGLIVVCLPKRSFENQQKTRRGMILAGAPNEWTPSFLYVSATGLTTHLGPHFVVGRSVATGFEARSLPRSHESAV